MSGKWVEKQEKLEVECDQDIWTPLDTALMIYYWVRYKIAKSKESHEGKVKK